MTEYRWLLPSMLVAAPGLDRPARRSTRDWIIDSVCFALALGFAVIGSADLLSGSPTLLIQWAHAPRWLVWLDLVAGVAASVALWWRRRWPVRIALALQPVVMFSVASAVAVMIVMFTVAVHRRFGVTAAVAGISIVSNAVFCVLRPERETPVWESIAWSTVIVIILTLWGMVVRSRRQLVVSLRDRAERAESEQQLRVAQARSLERTRIAREMHDVLAHRISLLSLHAGALEIHPDAAPAEVAGAAGVIRASAHQALQDLREVIGVLRTEPGGPDPERPQPTLGELVTLAGESRAAGMKVALDVALEPGRVPDGAGRTAYRIVQEGLTNARKHAPGTAVTVAVHGAPGDGLHIEIRNRWPVAGPAEPIPGTGTGLIGLAERASLAGGRLSHGRGGQNEFVLSAWLPWPA